MQFFENFDNEHCFQACLKMILQDCFPERAWSWEELETLSGFQLGKWTWPYRSLLMLEHECETLSWNNFDVMQFAERGESYLEEVWTDDVLEAEREFSDLLTEQQTCRLYAPQHRRGLPTIDDVRDLLLKGYRILCHINAADPGTGMLGHFVVVTAVDDATVTIHDPGLPPLPHHTLSREEFALHWEYPNEDARNLIAIRPRAPIHGGAQSARQHTYFQRLQSMRQHGSTLRL